MEPGSLKFLWIYRKVFTWTSWWKFKCVISDMCPFPLIHLIELGLHIPLLYISEILAFGSWICVMWDWGMRGKIVVQKRKLWTWKVKVEVSTWKHVDADLVRNWILLGRMGLHSQNFLLTNLARITKYSAVENGPGDGHIKLGTDFKGELHMFVHSFHKVRINSTLL